MKNGWNRGGQERLPVGEFVELCVCENPNTHFQLVRWLIIKAYWDGEHWCHAGAERVQGLIGGWRPIRVEHDTPPKKRSGFITLHWNGCTMLVRAKDITAIYDATKTGTAYERLGDQGETFRMCDETPEQILKLIEEVEG